jgi:hypothetical protein
MTPLEIRAYVRQNPIDWPDLSDQQRAQLASLLRPAAQQRARRKHADWHALDRQEAA